MSFTGNENHRITLDIAAEMTARYRNQRKGGFFGKRDVLELLDQAGCVGFRYYYGFDNASNKVLVLVGVDEDENDLVNGILLEISLPCPTKCSTPNELNS